jgi:hypothetical protein
VGRLASRRAMAAGAARKTSSAATLTTMRLMP